MPSGLKNLDRQQFAILCPTLPAYWFMLHGHLLGSKYCPSPAVMLLSRRRFKKDTLDIMDIWEEIDYERPQEGNNRKD